MMVRVSSSRHALVAVRVLTAAGVAGIAAAGSAPSDAASAASETLAPCSFAHGLQVGPWTRRISGGVVISLRIENTRGRSACRFRSRVGLALLEDETRLLLPVRGNPTPEWAVDRVVPKGTMVDVSWLWRNWCRHRLTAAGSLSTTAAAGPPSWLGLFRSPGCSNRRRASTLAAYRLKIVR